MTPPTSPLMSCVQVAMRLNNLADYGTVDDENYEAIMAHDAAQRARIAALEQEAATFTYRLNASAEEVRAAHKQLHARDATIHTLEGALKEAHDVLHDGRAFYPLKAIGILKLALALPQAGGKETE